MYSTVLFTTRREQLVIAEGTSPSDGDLLGMGWFVNGVEGSVNQ